MEVITLADENKEEWNKFCENNSEAWFFHTTFFLDYVSGTNKNLSFFIKENNEIIAIAPIIISGNEICFRGTISGRAYPLQKPALKEGISIKQREKVLKLIFSNINAIAKKHNINRVSFRFSPLESNKSNFLMKYGFLDISLNSQVIHLSKTIDSLWADVRHGHKYLINKMSKILSIEIYDKSNLKKTIFDEYVAATNEAKLKALYDWTGKGMGILFVAKKANDTVGFAYISTFRKSAYYFSSFNNSRDEDLPVSHFMQWEIIKWLKEKGFQYYEIGWQQFSPQVYDFPSDKELNICLFKRGFGGETVPLFIGEKFYSKEHFVKEYTSRINKYAYYMVGKNVKE